MGRVPFLTVKRTDVKGTGLGFDLPVEVNTSQEQSGCFACVTWL